MPAGGLIALLDDIASIADDVAKMTMTAADDIGSITMKASQKAMGIVTDDLAVTAEQMYGIRRDRELRVVWGVAKGSFKNKMLYLIPGALLLTAFAPWALPPLLVAGGAFLCYEGAEKVVEKFHKHEATEATNTITDPLEFERVRVAEAIRTDLVLSGEIMVMGLGTMSEMNMGLAMTAISLVAFGTFMTAAVYGTVGILVKMDDVGEAMALHRNGASRNVGKGIVLAAPKILHVISWIGLVAMLAVGGHLATHNIHAIGEPLHHMTESLNAMLGFSGFMASLIAYGIEIIAGLIVGLLVIAAMATGLPGKAVMTLKGLLPKRASPNQ